MGTRKKFAALDLSFASKYLARRFATRKALAKTYGDEQAQRIIRRLDDLIAAPDLAAMRATPGRCHELVGDRAGTLALDLKHPYRLIFAPAHAPIPRRPDGGLDWAAVTAVQILAVEDYHG